MMDKTLQTLLNREDQRQQNQLQLIPSENYASKAVLAAVGSCVINKYSEGQIGKRYYQGNENIDEIEKLAKKRALDLFGLDGDEWSVNVQAYNGSIANLAVLTALLNPGDNIMSMYLYDGGHLSHGWQIDADHPVSLTGKLFKPSFYHVDKETETFDYVQIEKQAQQSKPKLIISGGTGYPRDVDYHRLGQIAKDAGAYYLADVAHEAGLIAGGVLSSPFKYADVVTMTTRKTLRGPIGALIFSRHDLAEKIDRAVFPGLQGGPPNHQIAGIAQALYEAQQPEFTEYARKIVSNAKTLADELKKHGLRLVSGGTDKHLMLVDLRNKEIDGWAAAWALEAAGIIVNRSTIPYDTGSPYYPSGIRLGTPAITTRGMREKEMTQIAAWIKEVIDMAASLPTGNFSSEDVGTRRQARKNFKDTVLNHTPLRHIADEVKEFCQSFPLP